MLQNARGFAVTVIQMSNWAAPAIREMSRCVVKVLSEERAVTLPQNKNPYGKKQK